jgi:hypothetical protein
VIRWTTEDGKPVCEAELSERYGVYLDNDSLIEIAKGPEERRERFVHSLQNKGGLLFSLTNAVELAGPQGASADAVRRFLDSIGAHWIPLELNPYKVSERERDGVLSERAAVSDTFIEAYFQRRAFDLSPEGAKVLDLSESFFRLGTVLDWIHEDRDSTRADAALMDETLRNRIAKTRAEYEKAPSSLDRELPPVSYDSRRPATFALIHLLRGLVIDAKAFQFKEHDALDLCHTVLAAAYASVATLDKQWKRRVEQLPAPNQLARIFYRPEVDQLVTTLEGL